MKRLLTLFFLLIFGSCNSEKECYCQERADVFLKSEDLSIWKWKDDRLKLEMGGVLGAYKPYTCIVEYSRNKGQYKIESIEIREQ